MCNILEGVTALQDDIAAQLRAAAIPEAYIDMIMGLIAGGELERQHLEDARAIDALAADEEAEREAYDRWAATAHE